MVCSGKRAAVLVGVGLQANILAEVSIMALNSFRDKVEGLLSFADVKIGGDRPWDIQVHNEDLYARLMAKGSLGLGESYMDGRWDIPFAYHWWKSICYRDRPLDRALYLS